MEGWVGTFITILVPVLAIGIAYFKLGGMLKNYAVVVKEVKDVFDVFGKMIADGEITADELKAFFKEGKEVFAAIKGGRFSRRGEE